MVTLDRIRAESSASLYPCDVLDGCETALVLFAAAWHGRQDAIHIADAGLTATCVDLDAPRLMGMSAAYPQEWEYVYADVFAWTETLERQWDVVSIDCPSNLFDRCASLLQLWCKLARSAVVLGCGRDTEIVAPSGWRVTEKRYRSGFLGGVYWSVLERDA